MPEDVCAQLAKQAIQETLYRYCRGIDRMDLPLTRACWHVDGTARYEGTFDGTADDLLTSIWKIHATMQSHSHQMTNLLIEVAADRAVSETYVTVALRTQPGKHGASDILTRGRYIDRWSRRNESWAIDHRHYLTDWMTFLPVGTAPSVPIAGRRDADDPSYAAFAELRSQR